MNGTGSADSTEKCTAPQWQEPSSFIANTFRAGLTAAAILLSDRAAPAARASRLRRMRAGVRGPAKCQGRLQCIVLACFRSAAPRAGGAVGRAANHSLWLNGRNGGGRLHDHADFTYWGPSSAAAGVNKKAINWDGHSHVADQERHRA
jgi:hypothetical protein